MPYAEVPLGVQAVVSAIYEPQQKNGRTKLQIEYNDQEEKHVVELCEWLGLKVVGVVFTDLEDAGQSDGTVCYKRYVYLC